MADYDIYSGSSFVTLGGDGFMSEFDDKVKSFVTEHYRFVWAALVILVLIVLWMWFKWTPKESFNPGQTLRAQQRDDTGATNNIQNNGVGIVATQQAVVAPQPGTAAYDILNDPNYNCAGRTPVGTDAWAYMTAQAQADVAANNAAANNNNASASSSSSESFHSGNLNNVPINDNKLTAILSGH